MTRLSCVRRIFRSLRYQLRNLDFKHHDNSILRVNHCRRSISNAESMISPILASIRHIRSNCSLIRTRYTITVAYGKATTRISIVRESPLSTLPAIPILYPDFSSANSLIEKSIPFVDSSRYSYTRFFNVTTSSRRLKNREIQASRRVPAIVKLLCILAD